MFLTKCPKCGHEFEITQQLRQDMQKDIEKEIREKTEAEINTKNQIVLRDLKNQIDEKENRLKEAENKELELKKREREILEKHRNLEKNFQIRLESERSKIEETIRQKMAGEFADKDLERQKEIENLHKKIAYAEKNAKESLMVEMQNLKNQIEEKDRRIKAASLKELEFLKKKREIEQKEQDLELEMLKKLDREKAEIERVLIRKIDEEHRQKSLEKDKKIQDLTKMLEEAKRKAEQGSMQTQGEVLELDFEKALQEGFPRDIIEPVPKGIKGADIIQRVISDAGKPSGVMLWEVKSTKAWSDSWIDKLKVDQRTIRADIAVILTQAMPREMEDFGLISKVWVCNAKSSLGLAMALRMHLIELNFTRNASVGKNEKMEAIYQYLSGNEFRQKVEAIVEAFRNMQEQLDKEKRAMNKIWKEREKQIERIMLNTVGMYGDVKGIIGASLQDIPELELDSPMKSLPPSGE